MNDMHPVKGTVLISGVGASQGVGVALARRFAREGYPVLMAGRSPEKLAASLKEFAVYGSQVQTVTGDCTRADDIKRFVETAMKMDPIAVAVHNAGSNNPAPFLQVTEEQFTSHWREHALGAFLLSQAVLPHLVEQGGGSLFFTGASGSLRGKAHFSPFAAAKGALRNLAQSIAREYGPHNIHVGHVVIDGGIDGERLNRRRPEIKQQRGPDGVLNVDAIADAYWFMHQQPRNAWTLELDLRPWAENF
ncbi:MAG: SDR family NAD(P)-dependent oxidoreductase [Limnohabitans sp.]|nr:SDR family NAD(P)-dependent oxidoreductase [Limnohabitans sp.]